MPFSCYSNKNLCPEASLLWWGWQLAQILDCRCAVGNICLSRKEWHPDTLQKLNNRQQMAAIFIHQWLAWTPFWLTSVNGLIICPVLLDFCIYLKLRKLHTWWQLFFKLPNKNKASNNTQFPDALLLTRSDSASCPGARMVKYMLN